MDKDKAFNEVKELLTKNGIEFTVSEDGDTITVEAGRILQWFQFTEISIAVISSVIVDHKDIETSRIDTEYEDIEDFCLIKGDLWIREKGFGYTIITLKDN
mgnify:CR=1 FL=1